MKGMEVLFSLPRGPGALWALRCAPATHPDHAARLLADIPAAERPALEVLRTDTATWPPWSSQPPRPWRLGRAQPLHSNICNRSVPTRAAYRTQEPKA